MSYGVLLLKRLLLQSCPRIFCVVKKTNGGWRWVGYTGHHFVWSFFEVFMIDCGVAMSTKIVVRTPIIRKYQLKTLMACPADFLAMNEMSRICVFYSRCSKPLLHQHRF